MNATNSITIYAVYVHGDCEGRTSVIGKLFTDKDAALVYAKSAHGEWVSLYDVREMTVDTTPADPATSAKATAIRAEIEDRTRKNNERREREERERAEKARLEKEKKERYERWERENGYSN